MWQLHQRWHYQQSDETRRKERVTLESFLVRRILTVLVVLGLAADAALLAIRFVHPFNPTAIALSVLGGAALGLLLTVIPAQALRVLLRGAIWVGLYARRRRLHRLVQSERAALRRAAEETPGPRLANDLAVGGYLRGEAEAAEDDLERVVALAPEQDCLRNNLAVLLAARGQYERAAELLARPAGDCCEAMALNCALVAPLLASPQDLETLTSPDQAPNATALNNVGVSYARQGNWETATDYFTQALTANPNLPAARANVGLTAYRKGLLQEAADNIMLANRQAPNEPDFASYLSVILASAGQIEQARFYARRARKVDPASTAIGVNTYAIEALNGHWQVAERGFQSLLSGGNSAVEVTFNLALANLANQDFTAAAANAATTVAAGDTSAEAYTLLAVALWDSGRHAEALSHFTTASEAADTTALGASNLGRALLLQGKVERALAHLEQARQRWPEDTGLALDLATATVAWGAQQFRDTMTATERQVFLPRLQRHSADLLAACRRGGESAVETHVNLGHYLYMQEQYEAAAEQYEAALRREPSLRQLNLLIGTALGLEGERQTLRTEDGDFAPTAAGRQFLRRAIPYLEAAVAVRDIVVPASYNLARCLYVLKEYERALVLVRRALRLQDEHELNTLAALAAARQAQKLQLLYRTGMLSEARRGQLRARALELLNVAVHYFRQGLLRNEMDPVSHGNLGIAYMLRNREHDVESALRHWERMRAIGGGKMERRYSELAQMENLADPSRVGFDDRNAKLRGLELLRWLAVPPPRPSGVRFVMEPVAVQLPWRLVAYSPRLRQALALRDRIAAGELRLARLRV